MERVSRTVGYASHDGKYRSSENGCRKQRLPVSLRRRIDRPTYRAKIEDPSMPDVGQGSSKDGLRSTGQGNREIILSNFPRAIR
jgi:hypothetical protein